MDKTVLFWVIIGVVLIIIEWLVPGLVVIFLGISALLVALGIHLGLLTGWIQITMAWLIISVLLVLTLRDLFGRFAPGNLERGNMDEDLDAFGTIVKVVEVGASAGKVRIRFRGTTWDAECLSGELAVGDQVRMLKRENLVWVVELVAD